ARLASLSEDDPEIEQLAQETAKFIKSIGLLDEFDKFDTQFEPLNSLRNKMIVDTLPPARKKFDQLCRQYLYPESDKQPGGKTGT
ncbi:MAG: MerR family transcriptional regulator, partial [Desulfosporosinus sp.]